jgi:type II secretory pathway component PulJ
MEKATLRAPGIRPRNSRAGFSLLDSLFALALGAIFFGALYLLTSQCLYLLSSGRETTLAQESLQDRIEQLRNCTWPQITDANYIANNVLNTPSNDAAFLAAATETATINAYPTALSPAIQVTRSASTVTIGSSNSAIANSDLVRVDIVLNWTSSPGRRAMSVGTSTVYGENSR